MAGIDPLTAATAAGLTTLVTDILKGQGRNALARLLGLEVGPGMKQVYFDASKKYIQNYAERHGSLKVLGMREPVSLESVYTTVQVLDREDRSFASVEDLEQAFWESQERRFRFGKESKQDGVVIANERQYLMVLGAPGAGKSTFLRKLGLETFKGKQGGFQHRCIPILLELKRFTEAKVDLKKLIAREFQVCGFPDAERFTQQALEQGNLLILLDGLDEVPSANRDAAIEAIQDFVDQYGKNRYITSCRIAAYRHNFRRFTDVTIAEFSDVQIQQFIRNWFRSKDDLQNETAQRCWKLVQLPENVAVKELAYTPLLLTFLCLVYDRSQALPSNRSALYRKALRVLLEEWAAEKRIFQDEIYRELSIEIEELLLSEIAYSSFCESRLFFYKSELSDKIKRFFVENLNAPRNLSGEKILEAIAIQQGILVERDREIYSFSHLALQEYLTAQYITDHNMFQWLAGSHLTDRRWREVFLLTAGLMHKGSDEFLLAIERATKKYTETPKLNKLLQWVEQITSDVDENFEAVAKRAAAIQIAAAFIPNLTFARTYTRSILRIQSLNSELTFYLDNIQSFSNALKPFFIQSEELSFFDGSISNKIAYLPTHSDFVNALSQVIAIARDLALIKLRVFEGIDFQLVVEKLDTLQALILSSDEFEKMHLQFSESLRQAFFEVFKLDAALLEVSQEEARSIEDYLFASCRLLECKDSSLRLSALTWESISARMLLPEIDSRDREFLLVQRFLEQVGAEVQRTGKRSLEVSTIPEGFRLTSPFPVLIVTHKPTEQDVNTLFEHYVRLAGKYSGDYAGILLYQEPPDTPVREQIADLRLHYRFMVIPVSLAEVEKALPDPHECKGVLRNYVNRYIEHINFFDDSNAISDKATFFGRIGLLQQLEKGLLRNQGVALFGLRKAGKTSVLLQLNLLLRDYPVIYIDLQRYGGSRYGAELFNEILQKLSMLLNDRGFPPIEALDLFEPGVPAVGLVKRFTNQVSKLSLVLQSSGYKNRILCFLDEVERVLPGPREEQREMVEEFNACFGALRALSQEQQLLALLVADVHPDCNQINQWKQEGVPTNPVYSFFKEVFLKPFSEEDTKTMLTDIGGLMKLKFDGKTLEEIHRLSGGHPYISRQLAGLLSKKVVVAEDGLICWLNAQRYLERPFAYARPLMSYIEGSIWNDLEKRGFKAAISLLKILALEQNGERYISEQSLLSILSSEFTESQCLEGLLWLEDVGLIVRDGSAGDSFYRLHLILLSHWLRMQLIEGETN